MIRILHTADWHLGKRLRGVSMHSVQSDFCDWLVAFVEERAVDVLLVSGDIFDQANPPVEARQLYFQTLSRLSTCGVQVVLTAGNHDSPSLLLAPKELLSALRIHVVGTWTGEDTLPLIPLCPRSSGAPEAVVAAVPFVRDHELERFAPDADGQERAAAVAAGVRAIFAQAAEWASREYGELPALAMGHLFAAGVSTSEGEREIQVGNLGAISAGIFPDRFQYVALGHIHKPQSAGAPHVMYSGSPYPLSFSEREDTKRVMLLEVADGQVQWASENVPFALSLRRVSGPRAALKSSLQALKATSQPLTLVEVVWTPPHYDAAGHADLEEFIRELESERFIVARLKIQPEHAVVEMPARLKTMSLQELQPTEVFETHLARTQPDPEKADLMRSAFAELYQTHLQSALHANPEA